MANEEISIAVVDDHPIFRAGLIRVLNREKGFRVVAEGNCAEDAIKIATDQRPDIIILDISMPGDGLNAARVIIASAPKTKVMMLTVVEDDTSVSHALAAGAKGYVLKGVSGRELVQTIWTMQRGESFVSPDLAAHLLSQMKSTEAAVCEPQDTVFSEQTRTLLTLLAAGHPYGDIAVKLGVDVDAVKTKVDLVLTALKRDPMVRAESRRSRRRRTLH